MKTSVIIPVYNGSSTIKKTLDSLFGQSDLFDQIIVINDGSNDDSGKIIAMDKRLLANNCRIITHKKPVGLAATYNHGVRLVSSDLVITLHQDVLLMKGAVTRLLEPFSKDNPEVVASTHVVLHPIKVWKKYNFWQRVFFSRLVEKKFSGIDGKFDCFRKSALLKVGLFDSKNFRTAGEDGDMVYRLSKIGKIVSTNAEIVHLHQASGKFSFRDLVKKQAQYSEAQGVLLRRKRVSGIKQFVRMFFRELMLLALLMPYVKFLALSAIVLYSFSYTAKVFINDWRDIRIVILPFVNILLLFVSFLFSIKGFLQGKQTI